MEYRALVDGVDCGMSMLTSGTVNQPLFDEFGIGNACSAELSLSWYMDSEPPEASRIDVQARESSEDAWTPEGTFYLDTRDQINSKLTVEAYDAMLMFEAPYVNTVETGEWPRSAPDVVTEMCNRVGISLDSSVALDPSIMVEYPDDRTMREVLASVAAAHAGNWIITARNTLYLVTFDNTESLDVGLKVVSCKPKDTLQPVSGLLMYYDDENAFMAGDDTGYVLNAFCYFATQAIAESALSKIKGYVYTGFEATAVPLPIDFQLGRNVTIKGKTYLVADRTFKFTPKMLSDIKAPGSSTVEHEYNIEGEYKRALKRKVQLGSKYFGVSISRQNGLVVEKTDSETVEAKAVFNTDTLAFYQGNTPVFFYDSVNKHFTMTASVDITAVNELQEQVNLKLDANQVSIAVRDQLAEGVDGVKVAGKDYEFGVNGLVISAGAYGSTITTVDETGMEVVQAATNIPILTVKGDNVVAKNVTVSTYFNIANSVRVEKMSNKRIGYYWIGD